jgi:hypothetical protein
MTKDETLKELNALITAAALKEALHDLIIRDGGKCGEVTDEQLAAMFESLGGVQQ